MSRNPSITAFMENKMSFHFTVGRAVRPIGILAVLAACNSEFRTAGDEAPTSVGLSIASSLLEPATLIAAGDIAHCSSYKLHDDMTAVLASDIIAVDPGAVVAVVGDNAYPDGTATDYANCYAPTWGVPEIKSRTKPVVGNREYVVPGAAAYFDYFGAAAGDPSKGYYSYDLGAWHIIVLNDNINYRTGSPQNLWLRADLAANPTQCTMAMWHTPRFYNTGGGTRPSQMDLWTPLYDAGVEIILGAHTHYYERYAKNTPAGIADPVRGIRQFLVGMGGKSIGLPVTKWWNSEMQDPSKTYGVVKFTLEPDAYSWEFVPIPGGTFRDTGRELCH